MPPPYRCVAIELLLKSRNSPQEAIGLHCKTIYSATVALVAQHRFCEFTATPATVLCVCAAFYGGWKLSSLRRRHRLALPASTFDGTGYVRNFFLFSRSNVTYPVAAFTGVLGYSELLPESLPGL